MDIITLILSFTAGYVVFIYLAYRLAKVFFHSESPMTSGTHPKRTEKK